MPRVRRFLAHNIDSIGTLELLLFLAEDPAQSWTLDDLVQHLRSALPAIKARLEKLARLNLVKEYADGWRYSASVEQDMLVKDTLNAYRERRVSVIDAIYEKPEAAYREFADAFSFREKEREDEQ